MADGGPNIILSGALVKVYLNNKVYKESQSVSWSIDYGEAEIYGIDSPFPQEIAPGRVKINGRISGLRIKYSGGIQGYNARSQVQDILASPYISIRIQDRSTNEDLIFIPNAKITGQNYNAAAKGIVRVDISFSGLVPLEPLDRVP